MNNSTAARCLECGRVDSPITVGPAPAATAVVLWASAAVAWAAGFALGVAWLTWVGAAAVFAAMVYTLWYFYKREQACRHCGGRRFEPTHADTHSGAE